MEQVRNNKIIKVLTTAFTYWSNVSWRGFDTVKAVSYCL